MKSLCLVSGVNRPGRKGLSENLWKQGQFESGKRSYREPAIIVTDNLEDCHIWVHVAASLGGTPLRSGEL